MGANLDTAKQKLVALEKEAEDVAAALQKSGSYDPADVAAYSNASMREPALNKELKAAQAEVDKLQVKFNRADDKVEALDAETRKFQQDLDLAKEKAGEIAAELAKPATAGETMADAMDLAEKKISEFTDRVAKLAKRAFIFTVIARALAIIRDEMAKYIFANDDARQAIAQLKGALYTLAQPLLNVLIPAFTAFVQLLTRVVSVMANLVSRIFGANIKQSKKAAESMYNEANAISAAGAAAEEAEKQLASFDTINKLGDTGGSEGGGASASTEILPDFELDLGMPEKQLDRIAELVKLIGSGFAAWRIGSALGLSMKEILALAVAIRSGIMLCEAIFDAWNNGVDTKNLTKALLRLIGLAGGLYLAFGQTAAGIALIVGGIALLVTGFKDIISNGANLQNTLMVISGIIAAGLGISLLTGSLFPALIAGIAAIVLAIVGWQGGMDELAAGLKLTLEGILGFIKHFFTGEWELLWEDVKKIFKGVFHSLAVIFVSVFNAIIDGWNAFLRMLNKFEVPDFVPGIGGWSPNFKEAKKIPIPKLAAGAVIPPNREFLAVLGDQKSGTNIEAPLATMVQAFRMALAESGGSGQQEVYLVLDEEVLGKVIYRLNKRETKRVGVSLVGGLV